MPRVGDKHSPWTAALRHRQGEDPNMRRTYTWLVLLAAFALVVAACGGDDNAEATTTTSTPVTTETFRIAVVAPSAANDLAFTQSMIDSLNVIDGEMDLEIAVTDGMFVVEDAAAAIRDYADKGYDLVIAHGSQYGGSLAEIAPDFPTPRSHGVPQQRPSVSQTCIRTKLHLIRVAT